MAFLSLTPALSSDRRGRKTWREFEKHDVEFAKNVPYYPFSHPMGEGRGEGKQTAGLYSRCPASCAAKRTFSCRSKYHNL
jgi:hypothetical protein